jgi:hypothetical protein
MFPACRSADNPSRTFAFPSSAGWPCPLHHTHCRALQYRGSAVRREYSKCSAVHRECSKYSTCSSVRCQPLYRGGIMRLQGPWRVHRRHLLHLPRGDRAGARPPWVRVSGGGILLQCGMVWYGMVWYGMVWYGEYCSMVYLIISYHIPIYLEPREAGGEISFH